MKGAILVPSHGGWAGEFGQSLVALATYCHAHLPPGTDDFALFYEGGSVLPAVRNSLVLRALEYGADWMLWIDSDMKFPHDALHRLMAHGKTIVGCNYPRRVAPFTPTAQRFAQEGEDRAQTLWDETGLVPVHHAGMGLLFTMASVYTDLKQQDPQAPWFAFPWNPKRQLTTGEDVAFQSRARTVGHQTYIDCDLSNEVSHIATIPVDMGWARGWKDAEDGR